MSIKCENLTFGYIKEPLLFCGASFELKDGEKALLLAPSNSGKTTFLKTITGLEDLYFGNIFYNNKNIKELGVRNLNSSLILNPPVLLKGKTVFDNLLLPYINAEEKRLKRTLKRKERILIKSANFDKIKEKMMLFAPNIDINCKISKLSESEKIDVTMIRSLLKQPENVFIDDVDKIENKKLLEALTSNKTVLATASKVCDFNVLFDKIFYLSLSKFYTFKTINEMREKRVDLNACFIFDDLKKVDAKIILDETGYYLFFKDKKYKFRDDEVKNLSVLSMELYDEAEVVLVYEETGEHEFILLEKGKLNIYDKLTKEKII